MPGSSGGSEPGSQSMPDAQGSESSDSSSSDFEIQAITTSDGVRTNSTAGGSETSDKTEQLQKKSESERTDCSTYDENLAKALGLAEYNESSPSDEDPVPKASPKSALKPVSNLSPKQIRRPKKRVRFADDPPEKKHRLEHINGPLNRPVNGHPHVTANDEAEEAAILAELANFEASVADTDRDTNDIEADLVDSEDAREQAKQHELEERVKGLREAVTRRKMQVKSSGTDGQEENSSNADGDISIGVDKHNKIG